MVGVVECRLIGLPTILILQPPIIEQHFAEHAVVVGALTLVSKVFQARPSLKPNGRRQTVLIPMTTCSSG